MLASNPFVHKSLFPVTNTTVFVVPRFDQKNFLARLLFTEDPDDEDRGPSESFFDKGESGAVSDDRQAVKRKTRRLQVRSGQEKRGRRANKRTQASREL